MRRPRQLHKPKEFKKLSDKDRRIHPLHELPRPVIFFRPKASKRLTCLELMIYSGETFLGEMY